MVSITSNLVRREISTLSTISAISIAHVENLENSYDCQASGKIREMCTSNYVSNSSERVNNNCPCH